MNCPVCGSHLDIPEGSSLTTCPFCQCPLQVETRKEEKPVKKWMTYQERQKMVEELYDPDLYQPDEQDDPDLYYESQEQLDEVLAIQDEADKKQALENAGFVEKFQKTILDRDSDLAARLWIEQAALSRWKDRRYQRCLECLDNLIEVHPDRLAGFASSMIDQSTDLEDGVYRKILSLLRKRSARVTHAFNEIDPLWALIRQQQAVTKAKEAGNDSGPLEADLKTLRKTYHL